MSRNYLTLGTFFYSDDLGYYDGVENTKKPFYPKRKDLFANSQLACSQINRSAKPVDLNFGSFCYQLTEPDNPSVIQQQNTTDDSNQVSLTDKSQVTKSISEFEASVFAFKYEVEDLDDAFDNVCKMQVPEDISYEERSDLCDNITNKVTNINSVFDLVQSNDYQTNKHLFVQSLNIHSARPLLSKSCFDEFTPQEITLLKYILSFEKQVVPDDPDYLVHIVYLPSGGGKTNFANKYKDKFSHKIFDIDEIMHDHWNYFTVIERFQRHLEKPGRFRNLANQYFFHLKREEFRGSILLLNHPLQVPAYYRRHELIIVPLRPNWDLRYFNYNFFSLLAVRGKNKVISDYDGYFGVIKFFMRLTDERN